MHSLLWLSTQPQSYDDAWWCHLFTFLLHITGYQCLHLYGCTSSSETILLFPVFPEPVLWCIVTYWRLWKCCSQTCVSLSLCFAHKCGAFLCHWWLIGHFYITTKNVVLLSWTVYTHIHFYHDIHDILTSSIDLSAIATEHHPQRLMSQPSFTSWLYYDSQHSP